MSITSSKYAVYSPSFSFNIPEAVLGPNSWAVISVFCIPNGYTASYANATLDILDVGSAPHTIVDASGLVSLGIYSDFDNSSHPRSQTAIETAIYAGTSSTSTRSSAVRTPTNTDYASTGTYADGTTNMFIVSPVELAPGYYSVVVANNTSDHAYAVCAAGVVQYTL